MRVALSILIFSLFARVASAETTITLYSEAGQYPFSYEENGIAKGAYVESLFRVTKKIPGYDVRVKFVSWARAVEEAKNGFIPGVLGVYYRPIERPFLNHSKAIFHENVAVYCNRDSIRGRKFNRYPDDFSGLKFSLQKDYLLPGPAFFELARKGKITIVYGIEFDDMVRQMLVGETDCIVNPDVVLKATLDRLSTNGLPERMKNKSVRIMQVTTESVHVGFSKRYEDMHPEFKKFRLLFDQAVDK